MAKPTTHPTCDRCGEPLPVDDHGVPVYWHTFTVVHGVPRSQFLCLACRDAIRQPVPATSQE